MAEKDAVQKIAEAPAVALEKTIALTADAAGVIGDALKSQEPVKKATAFWKLLGPGLTTGAADDDPSGIATYSQTGSQYGFQLLWLAAFTFPLMAMVQEMCARIGMVTGRGLAANIRRNFPRPLLILTTVLLFAANTFNLGADLGAMAKSVQLVAPSFNYGFVVVVLAILSLGLQIFTTYDKYARYLKYLALILLSYVVTAFVVPHLNWHELWRHAVIPSLTLGKDQLILVTAILGTTISPYLFFWQTSQEVEEEILNGKRSIKDRVAETTKAEINDMRVDVWAGMFLSNVVMFFIIAVGAAVLAPAGITTINSAADAAAALRPLAGNGAFALFTLGILGTGLLAVPVLAGSAAYALAECFRWKQGLYHKLKEASAFYGVLIFSVLIGLAMNFTSLDPIKALIYSAVANGVIAPIVLVFIVLLSSNKKLMGPWANSPLTTWIGWATTAAMGLVGIVAVYLLVTA